MRCPALGRAQLALAVLYGGRTGTEQLAHQSPDSEVHPTALALKCFRYFSNVSRPCRLRTVWCFRGASVVLPCSRVGGAKRAERGGEGEDGGGRREEGRRRWGGGAEVVKDLGGGEEKTAEGGSGGWMWVAGDHLLFSSLLFQTCSLATVVRVSAYSGRFERRPWSGGCGLPLASTVWVFRPGFRKSRPPQSDPQTSIDPASNSELATRGRVALKGRVALIAPIAGRRAVPTKWWHGCLCTGIGAA